MTERQLFSYRGKHFRISLKSLGKDSFIDYWQWNGESVLCKQGLIINL